MHPLAQDTDPRQIAEYYRLLRAMTPAQRFQAGAAATRRMRQMLEAGIRDRDPTADDRAVRLEMVRLLYGEAVVERLRDVLP